MKYSDEQLLNRVETHAHGFTGWKKGVIDIWVRSKADRPDQFDDKVYTFECKADGVRPVFVMVCTGTSHSGVYYQQNFAEYNPKGVAVLCADYFVENSHAKGFHNPTKYGKGHPAYRMVKGFPYTRDNDKDNKAENYGTIYNDNISAHCHRAKKNGKGYAIGRNSAACLVRDNYAEFVKWFAFMNGRPLSVAILAEF